MLKLTRWVGVAPGTMTLSMPNGKNGRSKKYVPYPTVADVRGNGLGDLGVVFSEQAGGWMQTGAVGRVYNHGQALPIATQAPTQPLSLKWNTSAGIPLPPPPGPYSAQLNGLGVVTRDWWQTGRTDGDSDSGRYNYPTNLPQLSGGGLGLINSMTSPYFKRAVQTEPGYPNPDPVFIQSPNAPNDEELSRVYQYTPVHSGWMYGRGNLGEGEADAVKQLAKNQDRQFTLQLVSTAAIVAMATIGIAKFIRGDKF